MLCIIYNGLESQIGLWAVSSEEGLIRACGQYFFICQQMGYKPIF